MSLVAYDSSDEGSENEESKSAESTINDMNSDATEAVIVQISSKLLLPAPRVVSHNMNDEEEEDDDTKHNFQQFLDMLPKPRDSSSVGNIEEMEDDILLKKETENQVPKSTKKQTVRISVPSLSEVCTRVYVCVYIYIYIYT